MFVSLVGYHADSLVKVAEEDDDPCYSVEAEQASFAPGISVLQIIDVYPIRAILT